MHRNNRRSRVLVVALAGAGLAASSLVAMPATAAEKDVTSVTLLNINDFHGRIDANTVKVAGTIEQERASSGEENTLLLSAGDNIGASLFASAVAKDQPTIDVLNALDLGTSAVGNHEFDQGFADLTDRVIPGSDFSYLGANVYAKGTTTPVLDEYKLFEVDGVTVGVIGAVTQETPTLVSPGGITTIDFGDPVAAVNRVASQLSDGQAGNGEADIIVAEYHEGANTAGATIEDAQSKSAIFNRMVTETSPSVDALFTGHTHLEYAWQAPVPGDTTGKTRPVVQTGSYGEHIGKIVINYDTATNEVVSHTQTNVDRTTVADGTLISTYPRVAEVSTIVTEALANAAEIGNTQIGSVTADVTSAFAGGSYSNGRWVGGTRDDRTSESTLGNLTAEALRAGMSKNESTAVDLFITNAGGLRNELYYAPDGSITYAEANAVMPFVNNLWTTTLTGEQLTTALEQQWQPEGASRPFLNLALSDNASYTFDASLPKGERVTSVWVDGALVDDEDTFTVGTFSFLMTGGDNFTAFTEGTGTKDTGLVDRDVWIGYFEDAEAAIEPNFGKQAVSVTGIPESPVDRGETVTLEVSKLNLTSLGSPENAVITAVWEGGNTDEEDTPVTNGAASIGLAIPEDAEASGTILLTALPSGTQVRVPVTVAPEETSTELALSSSAAKYGTPVTATATVTGAETGTVRFRYGSSTKSVQFTDGVATLELPAHLAAGSYPVTASFVGTSLLAPSTSDAASLTVAKASTKVSMAVSSVASKGKNLSVKGSLSGVGSGLYPTGKVQIRVNGVVVKTVSVVSGGKYSATLPKSATSGNRTAINVSAKYVGSTNVNAATGTSKKVTLK